jgi:prevent-host-death family protein
MNRLTIAEAEKDLFKIVEAAASGEPQFFVKNDEDFAVMISYEDFLELTAENSQTKESSADSTNKDDER